MLPVGTLDVPRHRGDDATGRAALRIGVRAADDRQPDGVECADASAVAVRIGELNLPRPMAGWTAMSTPNVPPFHDALTPAESMALFGVEARWRSWAAPLTPGLIRSDRESNPSSACRPSRRVAARHGRCRLPGDPQRVTSEVEADRDVRRRGNRNPLPACGRQCRRSSARRWCVRGIPTAAMAIVYRNVSPSSS